MSGGITKSQEVVLPYIGSGIKDDVNDPQFIMKRGNNKAVIYVNDFSVTSTTHLIGSQISLHGQTMLSKIKRLYISKVVLYPSDFLNINSGNNVISFTLPSIGVTVYTVTMPVTRIANITGLVSYLNYYFTNVGGAISPALPGGANAVTIAFTADPYSGESININISGIGTNVGVTLEWVTTSSTFTYGQAMFGWSHIDFVLNNTIGTTFFLRPKYLPCYYLDFISKVLSSKTKNMNRSTDLIVGEITYRYYFNIPSSNINLNSESTYCYNWDKSSITYFDMQIQDDFGRTNVGYITHPGTSITMEITAEQ